MLKITAVSYLNTYPFVYGIRESGKMLNYSLQLEVPSKCAESLRTASADIGLVPVGALPVIGDYQLITDFCIGATGKVKTVILFSMVPLEEIERIHLDFDSRTSVELVKVLASNYWNVHPQWVPLASHQEINPATHTSVVAIGDKTFGLNSQYPFIYDLAESWISFTGKPFVFAVWIAREKLKKSVLKMLNNALAFGVERKRESLEYFKNQLPQGVDCFDYLENNISYHLDARKREGMELFLKYLKS